MTSRGCKRGVSARLSAFGLLALAFPQAVSSQAQGGPGTSTQGDFLPQYRQILAQLQAAYGNVRIEGTHQEKRFWNEPANHRGQELPESMTTHFSYAHCAENEKVRLFRDEPRYFDRIFISQGGRNFFSSSRKSPEGPYFLQRHREERGRFWQQAFRDYGERVQTAPYTPFGCMSRDHPSHPLIANSPDFKIQRVIDEPEGAKTLRKIFFQYRSAKSSEPTIEGWVRLASSMNWALQDYEYDKEGTASSSDGKKRMKQKDHYIGSVRYHMTNGVAVPSEVEFTRSINGVWSSHETFILSKFEIAATPPDEFSLASIGLGDVEHTLAEAKGRDTSRTMVLLVVALAAFLVSILLYLKGRAIQKGRAQ